MIKNNEYNDEVTIEKKEWHKPQISVMNIKNTKSAGFQNDTEGQFWFITWGPS